LKRGGRKGSDRLGQSLTSLCGGALAINLLLAVGLIGLIAYHGLTYFWPKPIVALRLTDGARLLGEVHGEEADVQGAGDERRYRMKVGNRDVYGLDFRWVSERDIAAREEPPDAVLLERREWGNFYGYPVELRRGDEVLAAGAAAVWERWPLLHAQKIKERGAVEALEKGPIGDLNYEIEQLRLAERRVELGDLAPAAAAARRQALATQGQEKSAEYEKLAARLQDMRRALQAEQLVLATVDGRRVDVAVSEVVRAVRPNRLGLIAATRLYLSRTWEFLSDDPRESNTEGGIFPAIFGTVMMVFLMSFAVAPFGVLAALYLREYAREGFFVRLVRIAVNNLAGVPSIVFGVFGLGFFVYLIGGSIDRLFYPEALPTPTYGTGGILWASLTLALLTVPVVIVAAEEGLAAVPRVVREGSLALGATKFETIWRVVLPAASPGILTGMILAMARAAGEVAPLMIVGMVKLAPTLPIDGRFPFVHLERKFMHLGFHIYDVGFQSPNVEATQPLVFATALLLVSIVVAMNLAAVAVRNRVRRKYATSAV
jgi:phosphate transport system permease protein